MKSFKEFTTTVVTEAIAGSVVSGLVTRLDAEVAHFKTLHWNVSGEGFFRIHELFGEIYDELIEYEDTLAEKARGLGELISIDSSSKLAGDVAACVQFATECLNTLRSDLVAVKTGQDIAVDTIIGDLTVDIDSWLYKLTSSQETK